MTLGVYGDSYGTKLTQNNHAFWVELVAEKLNTEYKNYCESASSLFYSYDLFLNTHTNHDRIVFLITLPYRYTKPIQLSVSGDKRHHISGPHNVTQIKQFWNSELSMSDNHMLSLLEYWFFLMDEPFYKTAQELLVNDILIKRPDTVIVPCFYDSLTPTQLHDQGFIDNEYLYNLLRLQCRSLGLEKEPNWDAYQENKDIVNGHLTPEMNKILGQLVYNRIVNGYWDRFPTEPINHEFLWNTYYKKL